MLRSRLHSRGFTLAELMVVVAIVGVLAVLGIVGIRTHITRARAAEASVVIQAIRGSQEGWRAENATYLDVSQSGMTAWYPRATPNADYTAWVPSTHADLAFWQLLNVRAPREGVRFGYVTRAGPAGTNPNQAAYLPTGLSRPPQLPAFPVQSWYVVQALLDADGDGRTGTVVATSFSDVVYVDDAARD